MLLAVVASVCFSYLAVCLLTIDAVVKGFGWSNGALIWMADVFGSQIQTPDCGNITAADIVSA